MDVRDLSQYIIKLCGRETLDQLGTNKELLLQKIFGQDPSKDQVKAIISDAASFASNAEEQLFYEFVQNAYDANADSLFFYANEKYLIVLNNGEPFYTDFDIFETEEIREGQLYNFLAKGKSLKRGSDNKLGKYGQGSKLLYTLLTDVSENKGNEDLLIDTIFNDKKGPYLISWYNRNQLANLLQNQGEWNPSQGDDYKNNILFAKILMCYYPIAPGREEDWFSKEEALQAIRAFDTLVDPRRNLNFLNRGTALIIPLGKGKYERITSKENMERVKTRLGGFASITKDQECNKGKKLDHINVIGEEIEQHEVESVFVDFEAEGNLFHYQFAFNPVFAEINYVNLFKGLPILETKLQLGFIIDSDKFEVDSSRQRISDKDKTKDQLIRAFSKLITELRAIKKTSPEKFDYIYKAIVSTKYQEGEDFKYITESFQKVFIPFFDEYVLSSTGEYEKKENIRYFADDYRIPLKEVGITKYKWIDHSIENDLLHRHKVNVERIDFCTILADADPLKLHSWIKSLSREDYKEFHKFCDKHKDENGVCNYKLFRSDKGNLYSYNELRSTANIYYPCEDGMKFGECEHITDQLSKICIETYVKELLEKIKTNIESFRQTDSTKDDAAYLLEWIVKKDKQYEQKMKGEIQLLPNRHDRYVPFSDLMAERPQNTILFDNYQVKGYTPVAVKRNGWLLNPNKEQNECYDWVVRHWKEIKDNEEWGKNTHVFIADIKKVYEASWTRDDKKLTLYLNKEGKPIKEARIIVNNISGLTEEEYNYFDTRISRYFNTWIGRGQLLMPFEYYKELMEAPFHVESIPLEKIIRIIEISKGGLKVDKKLLNIIIKIISKYLNDYRTQELNGGNVYIITSLYSSKNYIDKVDADLKAELENAKFYRVPDYVQQLYGQQIDYRELLEHKLSSNESLLIEAIQKIKNKIKLLPIVKQANQQVVSYFFEHLNIINIDQKITVEDLKWQAIEFAIARSEIKKVFDKIRHKGDPLPESIAERYFVIGSNEYDIYELDEDYEKDKQTINSFLECLPSENYFKEHFYQDKIEKIDPKELYDRLNVHNPYLNLKQLEFCIDYLISIGAKEGDLKIEYAEEVPKALDMIKRRDFKDFDKYFMLPGVDYDKHIYAEKEILREDECLPENVQEWLDNNKDALSLFSRLTKEENPYVSVRKALLNDEVYATFEPFEDADSISKIDATIEWAIEKKFIYEYNSERFKTMMGIIKSLPSEYVDMPLLRYTGEVATCSKRKSGIPEPTFILERHQKDSSFLSCYECKNVEFQKFFDISSNLKDFIKEHIVYVYDSENFLFTHGFNKCPQWIIRTSAVTDEKGFPEYDAPFYQRWKKMEESKGITIHTSETPIAKNFIIMSSNESVFSEPMGNSEFGYEINKRVIIQQPNPEGLTLMQSISKNITSMNFFTRPFLVLQSLYIEDLEKGQSKSNMDHSNDIAKQMSTDDLEELKQVSKPVKELIEGLGLDKKEVERLAENKDKIKKILDNLENEEKESKINAIVGYIGELIYKNYLEKEGKNFDWVSQKDIGECDFVVKTDNDNTFVDIKTTVDSLKDGTAPFYLHRSQIKFMQKYPQSKFHIVRISLIDLDLKKSYEGVRDTFGKNADPQENAELKKCCEEIANKYWERAKKEDFVKLSPEYAIRAVQK